MKKRLLILLSLVLALLSACNNPDKPAPTPTGTEYKVAVIFPQAEWESVKPVVEWAKEEAEKTHPGVLLSLEWIDEAGAGMASKVKDITHDNSYAAVIGPEYSSSARLVARESLSYRIPVLMPMVTSAEFQRIYAETNKTEANIFCLAQSDVTQLEALIAKARQDGVKTLFMYCRNGEEDDYSASFEKNFYFLCKESGLEDYFHGIYTDEANLKEGIDYAIEELRECEKPAILFIPSSISDVKMFDKFMEKYKGEAGYWPVYMSDIANEPSLEGELLAGPYEGFSLGATPEFEKAWKDKFGTALPGGYAQLYDCVTLVALAASIVERGLSDTVREALESIVYGPNTNLASGNIHFSYDAPIAPREVIYQNWRYEGGKFSVLASAPHNIESGWDWSATNIDDYDDSDAPDDSKWYLPLEAHRALVVATSTGWSNYRHQADALAMYQMLKEFGYTDDEIILIMEDDVASYPSNPYPGEIRVLPDGEDLRKGAVIDYKLSTLEPSDLYNIMVGVPSEKTPVVIEGSDQTNVFVFWSGHGVRDDELKWGDKTISSDMIEKATHDAQSNFRKMFFVMDTCYSGSIPKYCSAVGLLFLCSAAAGEPSHADVYDEKCGTYLSNGFTRAFRSAVEANPKISLNNLYKEVARETTGSHAGVYNYRQYGSLTKNTFEEYTKSAE